MELQKFRSAGSSSYKELEFRVMDLVDNSIELKLTESLENRIETAISTKLRTITSIGNNISAPPASTSSSSYRKNVIITCVPTIQGENPLQIAQKIAKQINFLQRDFVDNCFRVAKKQDDENVNESSKPPTILLKCTTEIARDNMLRCYFNYIKSRPLTPSDIGIESNGRIYLNEHLSPELIPVLKMALELRRMKLVDQVASHSHHLSIKYLYNSHPVWKRVHNESELNDLKKKILDTPNTQQ